VKYSRAVLEFSRPPYEKSRPGERRFAPSWRGSPVSPAMGRRLPVQLVRRHSDIAARKAPRAGPDERLPALSRTYLEIAGRNRSAINIG